LTNVALIAAEGWGLEKQQLLLDPPDVLDSIYILCPVHLQVHLLQELCDVLQRISSILRSCSEADQQREASATDTANAAADTPTWMLPAAEIVLQCLSNMAAINSVLQDQSSTPAAAAAAAAEDGSRADSGRAAGWLAVMELACALEAQLDGDSSAYGSIYGLVQLLKTRLVSIA
jgi:hypothetical protein